MAVLTPDSATPELRARAFDLVSGGSSPDEVCARLASRAAAEEDDAALWLYSWALTQQQAERPQPRPAPPRVTE
jgi:hypothetical protein